MCAGGDVSNTLWAKKRITELEIQLAEALTLQNKEVDLYNNKTITPPIQHYNLVQWTTIIEVAIVRQDCV